MRRGFLTSSIATPETKAAIAARYRDGESGRSLAREFGVSDHTIYSWLREAGVERRTISKALSLTFPSLEARFDAKYIVAENACWVWTAGLNEDGYGCFKAPGESKAHRYSYTRHVGPIPDGLELDHTCKNRACVNPSHLEPVTHVENVRRASTRASLA